MLLTATLEAWVRRKFRTRQRGSQSRVQAYSHKSVHKRGYEDLYETLNTPRHARLVEVG